MLESEGKLEESLHAYEKLCNVRIDRQGDVKNWLWKLTDAIASLYHKEEAEYITNYTFWIEKDGYKMKKNGMIMWSCFRLKILRLQLRRCIMRH